MLDVVYSERWPAPNTQGTFRLVVALLYQFFVVYVCNIPHCAQIVNRFRGESRDSISFFHPGGGAPLAFPQGGRKAPWDFITVKGTRYVFAGSVCRSVMAIPHPPRSAGHHPPGKARRSWAENVRRCLKIRFETPSAPVPLCQQYSFQLPQEVAYCFMICLIIIFLCFLLLLQEAITAQKRQVP